MFTRAELETALAKAEADIRKAREDLGKVQAERAKANAAWDKLVGDRRKTDFDRRKPDSIWDHAFADRRKADSGRREVDASLGALIEEVAARENAYNAQSTAEADCAKAEERLNTAIAGRDQAVAALDQLNRAERKR